MLVYNYYQKNNKIIQCKGITISYRNNLLNNNKIKFNLDVFIQFESCHPLVYINNLIKIVLNCYTFCQLQTQFSQRK